MATRASFRPAFRSLPRHATRASRVQSVRAYASSSGAGGSSKWPLYGALGLGAAGLGYYFVTSGDLSDREQRYQAVKEPNKALDYQEVYKDIVKVLEAESYDDGSYGPVLVRLAWHASGTYDKNSQNGGSNGATMRFAPESDHGANAGLQHARDRLEPIYQKYAKQGLTYSDLWTLAGVCAVQELGGPKVPWRPGRQDGLAENCTPDGRLPDGDKGQDHLRWVFYKMGFNDQEIVALSGAHALGRCHTDRSGFDGPWTHSPISFTNEYYKLLYDERWKPRKWKGPPQFYNESSEPKKGQDAVPALMMLSTDISLIKDKEFKKWSRKYADDEELFFSDFSKAYAKLIELGVPEKNWGGKEPIYLKTSDEYE